MNKLLVALCILFSLFVQYSCGNKSDDDASVDSLATEINGDTNLFDKNAIISDIDISKLPLKVKETLVYQYSGARIKDLKLVDNGLDKIYKVELDHKGYKVNLKITANGRVLVK